MSAEQKEITLAQLYIHYYNSGTTLNIKRTHGYNTVTVKQQSYGDMSSSLSFVVTKERLKEISNLFLEAVKEAEKCDHMDLTTIGESGSVETPLKST